MHKEKEFNIAYNQNDFQFSNIIFYCKMIKKIDNILVLLFSLYIVVSRSSIYIIEFYI